MKFTSKMARLTMQDRNVDIQEGTRLRSIRRRLFQDDDENNDVEHGFNSGVEDNLANRFLEEARKNRENAKERWNFDFEKEEPLPGRYEWVKLDQDGNEMSNHVESNSTVECLDKLQDMPNDDKENSESRDEDKVTST